MATLLVTALVCAVMLALAMLFTSRGARLAGFPRDEQRSALYCGSFKSVVSGVPMARVLFPSAEIGAMILPLMMYHQLQMMVSATLAPRQAKQETMNPYRKPPRFMPPEAVPAGRPRAHGHAAAARQFHRRWHASSPSPRMLKRMNDTGAVFMMGQNPKLPVMPEKPKLLDFFHYRFNDIAFRHLLQSAKTALDAGQSETVVIACLLHDISNGALLRSDHGYWGAQMIAPYVTEEVAWAVQNHQALRYFADEAAGFKYPDAYNQFFGAGVQAAGIPVQGACATRATTAGT